MHEPNRRNDETNGDQVGAAPVRGGIPTIREVAMNGH